MKIAFNRWSRRLALPAIIVVGVILRFYGLGRADVITDEASVSFRSIGYLDFLGSPFQTTPLEWLTTRPWWLYLSFHDHPPLNFLLQHGFFSLLGVSTISMRLLPALAGVASLGVLYLIGNKLVDRNTGLLAAAILAINDYHVWISRLALQESVTIFFILLSYYLFLCALEQRKYFYWFGLFFGLGLLIKLNVIIVALVVFAHLIVWRRDIFRWKEVYLGGAIAVVIFSPYIIYNYFLYKTFGHFDFQFSYLFHQPVAAWAIRPGRNEFPTLVISLKYFFINLRGGLSPMFLLALALSLVWSVIALWRRHWELIKSQVIIQCLLVLILFAIFLLGIGPSKRFLSMIIPWFCLLLAFALRQLINRLSGQKRLLLVVVTPVLIFEIFFSFTTNISYAKIGPENWTYSPLKNLSYAYGYNELDDYLSRLTAGKKPAIKLPIHNPNLDSFVEKQVAKEAGQPEAWMFIYDPRMYGEATFWSFTRRMIYQGWPTLSYGVYYDATTALGQDFFRKLGITKFYFIQVTDDALQSPVTEPSEALVSGYIKTINTTAKWKQDIRNHQGQVVFKIYSFK